jgi:uncharacterized membrane protein YfcA
MYDYPKTKQMTGEIIAIALGLLVGLSLGALGGGGSTLAVPILVFVAGMQAQDATTASLLVVGVASAFGVVSHLRNGNVRIGVGVAFGAAGIVGSRVGTLLNQSLDENVLLLSFSGLILFVALRMYRSIDAQPSAAMEPEAAVAVATSMATAEITPMHSPTLVAAEPELEPEPEPSVGTRSQQAVFKWTPGTVAKLAVAATLVGLLTGLFGVGGGFAVVPALTLLLKFPAKEAIGTSLVVIVINAAVALAQRSGDLGFDWAIVAPFLVIVTVGVIVGSRVANGIDADRLTRGFSGMLGVVGIYTAVSTLLAM